MYRQNYQYNPCIKDDSENNVDPKYKKGQKANKQSKDSQKYKDSKELYKYNTKSQQGIFTKSEQGDIYKQQPDLKKIKEQHSFLGENNIKTNLKEERSQFKENVVISEEKLARLYIQNKGDILKIAFMLKQSSVENLCMMILPIVKGALKSLQSMVKKRKLRRVFLPWNDQELKEFIYKFFEIINGQLYGFSKKIALDTLWKLIEMKYDTTISMSNEQVLQFYKNVLDLHLSVYEDLENKTTNFQRHMTWSRQQLKVLCRLLLKTDNLQKVSDVMIIQFGRLKDKFSPKKLFERIDTLIKMSISKIKHQAVTYPGLGELRKLMRHDFYNINYNQGPRYEHIRKQLIRYFERDTPPLQQTYEVLCKLNKFLTDERIHEKNQMSQSFNRSRVLERRDQQQMQSGNSASQLKFNQSLRTDQEVKTQNTSLQSSSPLLNIRNTSPISQNRIKIQNDTSMIRNNNLLYVSNVVNNNRNSNNKNNDSFEKSIQMINQTPIQIPTEIKNLLQMDIQSLSSSSSSQSQEQNQNQEQQDKLINTNKIQLEGSFYQQQQQKRINRA